MARCTWMRDLEVHHKRRDGGNGLGNAIVLCPPCHQATRTYGATGMPPPLFDDDIRSIALAAASYRCECTSTGGCH